MRMWASRRRNSRRRSGRAARLPRGPVGGRAGGLTRSWSRACAWPRRSSRSTALLTLRDVGMPSAVGEAAVFAAGVAGDAVAAASLLTDSRKQQVREDATPENAILAVDTGIVVANFLSNTFSEQKNQRRPNNNNNR